MRWKRGSRAFLRLPCAWLLLLLPLAAAAGLGEEEVATSGRHHGAYAAAEPLAAGDVRPPAASGEQGSDEESSRISRGGRRLDEDEESRILWRGWLLVDEAPTRRKAHITPKSVFIAPVIRGEGSRGGGIPACAEGYRSDAMGRCHKVVRVNQAAHLDFLLQRLNALYREPSPPVAPAADAGERGPLLVTIPLATNPPQNEESEGEEDGDDVDLVVVVEAGMPKDVPGNMPDRLGLFGGEQVAAGSQDDLVVSGENRTPTETVTENAEDKPMADSAVDVEKNGTGVMESDLESYLAERGGAQTAMAHLQAHSELSIEPVIHVDALNSTEEINVRRQISGSDKSGETLNENSNNSPVKSSVHTTTERNANGTSTMGTTDDHFVNSHVYETTIIANYSTTELSGGKVTEIPDILHKLNPEPASNENISAHKIEDIERESQKRIVFPGRVEERIRFPDSEERKQPNSHHPSTTASSEILSPAPPQPHKSTSRPWGAWNRPMLLKFWTQMPLVREPTQSPDSVAKGALHATSEEDSSSFPKQEDSWSLPVHSDTQSKVHHGGPYQRRPWIYYQEMSPRDIASVSRVFDRVRHFESHG